MAGVAVKSKNHNSWKTLIVSNIEHLENRGIQNIYDSDICRICLNISVRGYKLDKHSLRSYYEYVIRRKLNTNDRLPQWVCYECATMLHKFHKFKEKCLRGQHVLEQISWRGKINYESVADINRYSENLISPIGIAVASKRVKTTIIKHKRKVLPKLIDVEKIMLDYDSEGSLKQENFGVKQVDITIDNSILIKDKSDEKPHVEEIQIKSETNDLAQEQMKIKSDVNNLPNDTSVQKTFDVQEDTKIDLSNATDLPNNMDINDDMGNTDHIDHPMSSDDENIFLDIVKKAVKGESKLVFIDNIEMKPIKKKRKYTKNKSKKREKSDGTVRKFEKPKKQLLTPEHWRKFNLTEEDAMREFKQRENSDQYVNANYKCHNCLKGFSKVEMLMRHVKFRHEESCGPIECRFCRMRFSQKNKLCKHLKQHYAVYQCLRCDMRFRLESSAIFHEDYHNGVTRKCKYCGEEFKHSSTYYTHVRMSHRSAHVCVACGVSFVSAAGLQQHRRIKHYDNGEESAPDPAAAASAPDTYCAKCNIRFETQAAYEEHLTHSNMHGDLNSDSEVARNNLKGKYKSAPQSFKGLRKKIPTTCQYSDTPNCETCGVEEDVYHLLVECVRLQRERRALEVTYQLNRLDVGQFNRLLAEPDSDAAKELFYYCGKHFATQGQCMKHHLAEHPRRSFYPPDKRHICEICGQSLAAVSIASHMNRHTREHVYPCATCGMQFISKSSHHRHQVTHTGERPYPCPLCEKRFTQKNSMQLHYRTFHLKQPYPKRNRRKKTDVEMPILECAINRDRMFDSSRDRSDIDSGDTPPAARWRASF